jgi:hypothetical protein
MAKPSKITRVFIARLYLTRKDAGHSVLRTVYWVLPYSSIALFTLSGG